MDQGSSRISEADWVHLWEGPCCTLCIRLQEFVASAIQMGGPTFCPQSSFVEKGETNDEQETGKEK